MPWSRTGCAGSALWREASWSLHWSCLGTWEACRLDHGSSHRSASTFNAFPRPCGSSAHHPRSCTRSLRIAWRIAWLSWNHRMWLNDRAFFWPHRYAAARYWASLMEWDSSKTWLVGRYIPGKAACNTPCITRIRRLRTPLGSLSESSRSLPQAFHPTSFIWAFQSYL